MGCNDVRLNRTLPNDLSPGSQRYPSHPDLHYGVGSGLNACPIYVMNKEMEV